MKTLLFVLIAVLIPAFALGQEKTMFPRTTVFHWTAVTEDVEHLSALAGLRLLDQFLDLLGRIAQVGEALLVLYLDAGIGPAGATIGGV